MGADVVEEAEVLGAGAAGVGNGEVSGIEVPELDEGGVVVSFDAAVELWPEGRQDGRTLRGFSRALQASSNWAWNSLPPSTWTDRTGKGMSRTTCSRKRAALRAVARLKTRATMNGEVDRRRGTP